MAVRKPRIPTTPKAHTTGVRRPGAIGAVTAKPADAIYNPPSRKRSKTIQQTQTPRTRDTFEGPGYGPNAAPIPAVRNRQGTEFGSYNVQSEEDWVGADGRVPQIDPTPSINPPRPRTLKAGYIKERGAPSGTLWVVFRDGTPWEYYDVPQNVWRNFRRVKSPGRFINRVLNNYDYGRGDF